MKPRLRAGGRPCASPETDLTESRARRAWRPGPPPTCWSMGVHMNFTRHGADTVSRVGARGGRATAIAPKAAPSATTGAAASPTQKPIGLSCPSWKVRSPTAATISLSLSQGMIAQPAHGRGSGEIGPRGHGRGDGSVLGRKSPGIKAGHQADPGQIERRQPDHEAAHGRRAPRVVPHGAASAQGGRAIVMTCPGVSFAPSNRRRERTPARRSSRTRP